MGGATQRCYFCHEVTERTSDGDRVACSACGRPHVVVSGETQDQRGRRERQRTLFDTVTALYDATRQGYPAEIVEAVFAHAGLGPGAAVLEIGCGTGQLTRQLAGREFQLTVIDIGAAMVAAARGNIADPAVRFQVTSFEDFAGCGPFDLIVSASAFHWVDPGVGLAKAARLLRPGGWLALLATGERYPEPISTGLRELWMRYGGWDGNQDGHPDWLTALRDTTLFGRTVEARHARPLRLPAARVLGVERTRATFLSYSGQDQAGFSADLRALLADSSPIDVVQETLLAMAPAAAHGSHLKRLRGQAGIRRTLRDHLSRATRAAGDDSPAVTLHPEVSRDEPGRPGRH